VLFQVKGTTPMKSCLCLTAVGQNISFCCQKFDRYRILNFCFQPTNTTRKGSISRNAFNCKISFFFLLRRSKTKANFFFKFRQFFSTRLKSDYVMINCPDFFSSQKRLKWFSKRDARHSQLFKSCF
jgi:hypothetical protein